MNIDKERLKLPEKMAKEERSDRSKVARRILDEGMKKWKVDMAVEKFTEGGLVVEDSRVGGALGGD